MKQYLLSIYQPDGDPPAPGVLEKISGEVQAVQMEMRAASAWVFSGGLHAASTATVVNPRSDEMPMTDGPYVEGRDQIPEEPDRLDQITDFDPAARRAQNGASGQRRSRA